MLFKTLKSNNKVNFILFPIMGIAFWFKSVWNQNIYPFSPGETDNLLFKPIYLFLNKIPYLPNIITLTVLIGMAFLMLSINNKYNFIRIRTKLPAPLFILIICGFTDLQAMHPVYFGAFFVLISIHRMFNAFGQKQPYSAAFDAGFFLGIAALFHFNIIILFPVFLIGIGFFSRETHWREFVILTLGLFLPFLFAFSFAYVNNSTPELIETFELNIFSPVNHIQSNIPLQIYLAFLSLLVLMGSISMVQQYDAKKISSRKFFILFLLLFIFSLISIVAVPGASHEMLIVISIPVTFLLSNFFVFLKSRFWGNFLFLLLFFLVIALQFSTAFING